jgi:hypothetical protein
MFTRMAKQNSKKTKIQTDFLSMLKNHSGKWISEGSSIFGQIVIK